MDLRVHPAGVQGDFQVRQVVVGGDDDAAGMLDSGIQQRLVLFHVAEKNWCAGSSRLGDEAAVGLFLDGDDGHAGLHKLLQDAIAQMTQPA